LRKNELDEVLHPQASNSECIQFVLHTIEALIVLSSEFAFALIFFFASFFLYPRQKERGRRNRYLIEKIPPLGCDN